MAQKRRLPKQIYVRWEDDVDGPWLNADTEYRNLAEAFQEVTVGRYVLESVFRLRTDMTLTAEKR